MKEHTKFVLVSVKLPPGEILDLELPANALIKELIKKIIQKENTGAYAMSLLQKELDSGKTLLEEGIVSGMHLIIREKASL